MLRVLTALFACAVAQAATSSATLQVNTTLTTTASGYTASGTATLTGGIAASGTFSATITTAALLAGAANPYTITTSSGTLSGTITIPLGVLTAILGGSTSASGASATITSATGSFAGDTGTFPNLSGSGSVGATGSISVNFQGSGTVTTGGTVTNPAPTITGILNNYSFIQPGFPNSGIAPGALFIIKGSGLADPAAQAVLQSSAAPGIPLTLNGASITVTSGGVTVHPGMYYAIGVQIAAVLPANTPVSNTATATVTYANQTSNAFTFQVVPAALGLGVYNGLAIATNATDYSLYSYTKSAKPGDVLVLWGSGLGAIPKDSDTTYTASPNPIGTLPQIYIGGIQANVAYAGDSGYPGVNQIDVFVPTNVLPGCNVSLVVVSGTAPNLVTSNVTAIAVDPSGGACSDPALNINGSSFSTFSGQGTVKTGFVGLLHEVQTGSTIDAAIATFQKNTGVSYGGGAPTSIGSCSLLEQITSSSSGTSVGLNAGTISLTGPGGSVTLQSFPTVAGTSFAQLAAGFIPSSGGSFTFSGAGGADVGKFSTTLNYPNPLLTWSNQAADGTVSRASGVDVNWSGGASGTLVIISGSSSNTATGATASFTCYAPVAAGTFHVPNSITLSMPSGSGTLSVENATPYQSFTATGIDFGYAFAGVMYSANATYN